MQIGLRVTTDGVAAIDKLRGNWTRQEWIRQAMRHAVTIQLAGPNQF